MSIETEINRISTNVSNTLSAVSEMGGEVPEGATSDDMASGVRSIPVGAKIDDTTPSSTTTYSSQKIESELTALNDANAALIEVSKTEPTTENTELWIHPNADEVHLPQINDSVESEQDTWSSKKIAAEVSNKANEKDLAVVAKSGSYNDLANKPTIPTVPSALPNPNALTFTGAVNETYDGSAAKSVAIPTVPSALPNPNKLTFTGAVTSEYDGSAPVSVEIPAGGGPAYELPIASPTTLGGVKPAAKTDEMTQAVGVDAQGGLWALPSGGESDIVQEQAVLASGTIASGTTAGDWETGVTVGDLRKWRYFSVSFRSASNQGGPWRFKLGNTVISYGGNWCCTWLFEWIDKNVAKLHSFTNIGVTTTFFYPGGQTNMQGSSVSQHFARINDADSSPVYVGSNPDLKGDLQWNVMGVLK